MCQNWKYKGDSGKNCHFCGCSLIILEKFSNIQLFSVRKSEWGKNIRTKSSKDMLTTAVLQSMFCKWFELFCCIWFRFWFHVHCCIYSMWPWDGWSQLAGLCNRGSSLLKEQTALHNNCFQTVFKRFFAFHVSPPFWNVYSLVFQNYSCPNWQSEV